MHDVGGAALLRCTFTANRAIGLGGAVYRGGGGADVVSCSFIGNVAGWGGGVFEWGCSDGHVNCVFAGNRAQTAGGAVYFSADVSGLHDCTLAENVAPLGVRARD
jgi:predicted outer membrane repeat protein